MNIHTTDWLWSGCRGITCLAQALPGSLHSLDISKTKCGDAGMAALATVLPSSLKVFYFDECDIGNDGWMALAQCFPLQSGRTISGRYCNPGMGRLAAHAWAASLAQMSATEEWSRSLEVSVDVAHFSLQEYRDATGEFYALECAARRGKAMLLSTLHTMRRDQFMTAIRCVVV